MNTGNNYMNNMNYNNMNMNINQNQNFNYEPPETFDDINNPDNSDHLLEKMEVTINTFLNNLKKDDVPEYPNYIQNKNKKMTNVNNVMQYNRPKKNININRNINMYNQEFNIMDTYQNLLNNNISNLNDKMNMNNLGNELPYQRQNKFQANNLNNTNNNNNNFMSYDNIEDFGANDNFSGGNEFNDINNDYLSPNDNLNIDYHPNNFIPMNLNNNNNNYQRNIINKKNNLNLNNNFNKNRAKSNKKNINNNNKYSINIDDNNIISDIADNNENLDNDYLTDFSRDYKHRSKNTNNNTNTTNIMKNKKHSPFIKRPNNEEFNIYNNNIKDNKIDKKKEKETQFKLKYILENIKKMNDKNLEYKKEIINLKEQYANMYNTIL